LIPTFFMDHIFCLSNSDRLRLSRQHSTSVILSRLSPFSLQILSIRILPKLSSRHHPIPKSSSQPAPSSFSRSSPNSSLHLDISSRPQTAHQSHYLNTHPPCSPGPIDVTSTKCPSTAGVTTAERSNLAPRPLSAGTTTAESPTKGMHATRTTGSASSAAR